MTDCERIAALAQQMELARKDLEEWPEWLRFNGGAHHAEASPSSPGAEEAGYADEDGQ
jgi:hypothetical protein